MHIFVLLCFCLKNKSEEPNGKNWNKKILIKKLLDSSLQLFNSAGAMRYGGIEMERIPGSKPIQKSMALSRGMPGILSGKTSSNSDTKGVDPMDGASI